MKNANKRKGRCNEIENCFGRWRAFLLLLAWFLFNLWTVNICVLSGHINLKEMMQRTGIKRFWIFLFYFVVTWWKNKWIEFRTAYTFVAEIWSCSSAFCFAFARKSEARVNTQKFAHSLPVFSRRRAEWIKRKAKKTASVSFV